jgi:anthranilate phosphoribosyltransferase
MVLAALANTPGAAREIVVLNAGLALYAANVADSIGNALAQAREAIESGAARSRLDQFVSCTQKLAKHSA